MIPQSMKSIFDNVLTKRKQEHLFRETFPTNINMHRFAEQLGKDLVLFSTNDYLGLSRHPAVCQAVATTALEVGTGSCGSPLVCGYSNLHHSLEKELAELKHTESALLFASGYSANLATIRALATEDTAIFSDALNHASIIDACRLARVTCHVYKHKDMDHLEGLIRQSKTSHKIIVTDSVFSMDGDTAPLKDIARIKNQYDCLLVIDEAHGTLVLGEHGGGLAEALGVIEQVDVHVGTLSKAFGGLGGFVASSSLIRDWLVNFARPYIYSTALPPPMVAAARTALNLTRDGQLQKDLLDNIEFLGQLLGRVLPTPIVPFIFSDERQALRAAADLFDRGFHVIAIRPPTVPKGTSRLRITVQATHSKKQLHNLVSALQKLCVCPTFPLSADPDEM